MEKRYRISSVGRLRMGTDGEGIRTLVFADGCPLKCQYCINPFTWNGTREPMLLSAKEIYEKIIVDRPYILATNGGVTFGGGEPLLQPEMIRELRDLCEHEMSFYVETSLNVPYKNVELVADIIDRFYVDIKSMDPDIYKEYTGGELAIVIDNLNQLLQRVDSEKVIVRVPMIPGYSDTDKQMKAKEKLKKLGVSRFNMFTYKVIK